MFGKWNPPNQIWGKASHYRPTRKYENWVLAGRPEPIKNIQMLERTISLLEQDNASLRRMLRTEVEKRKEAQRRIESI